MRVFVYYNLHRKCWSVKSLDGPNKGRVVGHVDQCVLQHCTFKVSEAGRQRVLRERRKNVHAGVVGELLATDNVSIDLPVRVQYNPYLQESFEYVNTKLPCKSAPQVLLAANKTVWV
jgi:hypothetical protein